MGELDQANIGITTTISAQSSEIFHSLPIQFGAVLPYLFHYKMGDIFFLSKTTTKVLSLIRWV